MNPSDYYIQLTGVTGLRIFYTNTGDSTIKRNMPVVIDGFTVRVADPEAGVINGISVALYDVAPGERLSSDDIAVRGAFSFKPDGDPTIWISTNGGAE